MQVRDPINTPSLSGWVIAAALGALGAAISWLQLGIEANGSVLIGGIVALVVGVIIGLPSSSVPVEGAEVAQPLSAPIAPAAAPAAPVNVPAAPVAPAATAPLAEPPVALAAAPTPVAAAVAAPIIDPAAPEMPTVPAEKPRTLAAARDGRPDDLKLIRGIGPKMEAMLHGMGFFHFDQIAAWTTAELAWVDDNLEGFKGRASRDAWVDQAKILASGGTTEFSSRNA